MVQTSSSYVFRDPSCKRVYLVNKEYTQLGQGYYLEKGLELDFAMNSYVCGIDFDIFTEVYDLIINDATKKEWKKEKLDNFFKNFTDKLRLHGYAVVVIYRDEVLIFSESNRQAWIQEEVIITDVDTKETFTVKNINGMKVIWNDANGNSYTDNNILWDDEAVFLFKWLDPLNPEDWATPDVNQSKLTLFYSIRQINSQLVFSSIKPTFPWFKTGNNARSEKFKRAIRRITRRTSNTSGLALTESQVIDIQSIEMGRPDLHKIGLDQQVYYLAGQCRLPERFFTSHRLSSGMSDVGETTDQIRINRRMNQIWKHVRPMVEELLVAFGLDNSMKEESLFEEVIQEVQQGMNENGKTNEKGTENSGKANGKE
jgi:hypothetical protein